MIGLSIPMLRCGPTKKEATGPVTSNVNSGQTREGRNCHTILIIPFLEHVPTMAFQISSMVMPGGAGWQVHWPDTTTSSDQTCEDSQSHRYNENQIHNKHGYR